MKTTEDIVADIISEQIGIGKNQISPDKSLASDLGADIFDTVEIAFSLEDRFGVHIPEDVADKFRTVGDILAFLKEKGV